MAEKPTESSQEDRFIEYLMKLAPDVERLLGHRYSGTGQADLEDVVAEGVAKLWQNKHKIDTTKPLWGYFYTTCKNLLFDRLLKQKRTDDFLRAFANECEFFESFETDDSPTTPKLIADVVAAMRSLSKDDQEVLRASVMFFPCEHWAKNLARELGVNSGTLRARKLRAKKKLIDLLRKKGHKIPGE